MAQANVHVKGQAEAKPKGETKDQKIEPKAKTNPGQVPSKYPWHGPSQSPPKDKQICWRWPELKSQDNA